LLKVTSKIQCYLKFKKHFWVFFFFTANIITELMFEFGMVKLVILLLTGPFIEFDCSSYRCSGERFFFT